MAVEYTKNNMERNKAMRWGRIFNFAAAVYILTMAPTADAQEKCDPAALRAAAARGDAEAQNHIGLIYGAGGTCGIAEDNFEAVKWFRAAAKQGHAEAQHNLGSMYYYGWGVLENKVKAIKWYRAAAEQGNKDSIYMLEKMGLY